jgi:hypothetical protein
MVGVGIDGLEACDENTCWIIEVFVILSPGALLVIDPDESADVANNEMLIPNGTTAISNIFVISRLFIFSF